MSACGGGGGSGVIDHHLYQNFTFMENFHGKFYVDKSDTIWILYLS